MAWKEGRHSAGLASCWRWSSVYERWYTIVHERSVGHLLLISRPGRDGHIITAMDLVVAAGVDGLEAGIDG